MAFITAREPGECRRCKRDFPAGSRIWHVKGAPILCGRCAGGEEPQAAAAPQTYGFQRGTMSGTAVRHAPEAAPLPASEPAARQAELPLAEQFREAEFTLALDTAIANLTRLRRLWEQSRASGCRPVAARPRGVLRVAIKSWRGPRPPTIMGRMSKGIRWMFDLLGLASAVAFLLALAALPVGLFFGGTILDSLGTWWAAVREAFWICAACAVLSQLAEIADLLRKPPLR